MMYDAQNSRRIEPLDPVMRNRVWALLACLEQEGEDVLIADGRRTPEQQDALFAQVPRVTHVNDSNSFHVHGVAIDIVPIDTFGMAAWNAHERYEKIARIATALGFEWGFEMWGFDRPHFQYRQGLTIADFKAGKKLSPLPEEPQTKAGRELRWRVEARKVGRLSGLLKEMLARRIERRLLRLGA